MKENIIKNLTAKDDKFACAFADKVILESKETDEWYEYFDDFASLLDHPKSLVRNRALYILAANAQWDEDSRFDAILDEYLAHITDAKPITARQCVKVQFAPSGGRKCVFQRPLCGAERPLVFS